MTCQLLHVCACGLESRAFVLNLILDLPIFLPPKFNTFKEIVKAGLTPMLSTLTVMENAETEVEVLGLGMSGIALNIGMYVAAPAMMFYGISKKIKSVKLS